MFCRFPVACLYDPTSDHWEKCFWEINEHWHIWASWERALNKNVCKTEAEGLAKLELKESCWWTAQSCATRVYYIFQTRLPMSCLIQKCQGVTDWKRIRSVLTLHRRHSPIHLIDSSMASSAHGCDIADIGACPPCSQTLLELRDDSQHIWRRSNLILVHFLGGQLTGWTCGALLFQLILSVQPCGTYMRSKS